MIKLNDSSIFTGQIKQLLKDFNLPRCPVLAEDPVYYTPFYLKRDSFYTMTMTKNDSDPSLALEVKEAGPYIWNEFIPNITTNLRFDNNLYDRYTHRYLGRYLRFIRDYYKIDLMSMYNCCDYAVYTKGFQIPDTTADFTSDSNYVCYSIPITQSIYSLYMDTPLKLEYCVGLSDMASGNALALARNTLRNLRINAKKKVDLINQESLTKDMKQYLQENLSDLVLYIKVPFTYKGKIVVLEGDYIEAPLCIDIKPFYYNPQLASYNNNGEYLLADKLMQYLTGNAITPMSKDYDIRKLNNFLSRRELISKNPGGIWTTTTYKALKHWICNNQGNALLRNILNNYDILGYVDSDIERCFQIIDTNSENSNEGGII